MRSGRSAYRMRTLCGIAGLVLALSLAACGESKEEKAEKSICSSRSDINSQLEHLKTLQPSSSVVTEVKNSLTAIANDLTKMVNSSKELSPEAKANVQNQVNAFQRQLAEGVTSIVKGGSASAVGQELQKSLGAIATAYQQDLAQIKC